MTTARAIATTPDDKPQATINIVPQATPIVLRVVAPKDELGPLLDARYAEVLEETKSKNPLLLTKASKGFREPQRSKLVELLGGEVSVFSGVLMKYLNNVYKCNTPDDRLDIFAWSALDLTPVPEDKYLVSAVVYLEPEVYFSETPLPSYEVELPLVPDDFVANYVTNKLTEVQAKHAVFAPVSGDGPAKDSQFAVISVTTVVDGKKWAKGCVQNTKVLVNKDTLRPPELYDTLLVAPVGVPTKFEYDIDEPNIKTKVASATVVVHTIYDRDTPQLDNDLAVSAGFENLAQLRAKLQHEAEDSVVKQRENMLLERVIDMIVAYTTISPLPDIWKEAKANEVFNQQKQMLGDENQVLKINGATSKDELLYRFADETATAVTKQLILRKYGRTLNIFGPHDLDSTHIYFGIIRRHILKVTKIKGEFVDGES